MTPLPIKVRDLDPHEEVFLARYAKLQSWALQLTANDHERAEDLVHDAYIQFTFAQPNLDSISNLNGYLYRMLRNLHLSHLRRSLRQPHGALSVVDYDSAEIGLRTADPRERITLQDQLREVCHYACMRKETSKAGSVLILRFLHGYYPGEIALVMRCTREAVEERLRIARSEARQYLADPLSLRFLNNRETGKIVSHETGFARTVEDFLAEIRQKIFASRTGQCLTIEQLEALYRGATVSNVSNATLAHIVSCPTCLDELNRILDLPSLAERFPTDTLGKDTRPKSGDGDGGGMVSGGDELALRKCRRAARDVREHKPQELCVSVNGYLMAAQKVGSELSEQTVSITLAEQIDFVEIFSEQNLRLLFLSLEKNSREPRDVRVELSDMRALYATLSFNSQWPTLRVGYSDPSLATAAVEAPATPQRMTVVSTPSKTEPRVLKLVHQAIGKGSRWFAGLRGWLRPAPIAVALSLILIAALLLVRLHVPTVSAAELLQRSALAEQVSAAEPGIATHRTMTFREQRLGGNVQPVYQRIEIWQSADHGIKLRRLYDEHNNVLAGEWIKSDGTSTIYQTGSAPETRTAPEVTAKAIIEAGEFWRLDASALSFQTLVEHPDEITVSERFNTYVLNYEKRNSSNGLIKASLILTKSELHPIEETLTITRNGEAREYHFSEAGFEKKPAGDVPPNVFQRDPEFLTESSAGRDDTAVKSSAPAEFVASPELEIEVTYLLNRIKADLGEQVSLTRTPAGSLRIEALAENDQRKDEILGALEPVRNNPAVRVEVNTVAEAANRQPDKSRDLTVREFEVTNNRTPADAELRAYFSKKLVGREAIDEEIARYTNRVMAHSRQALLHASALRKLVRRFSPADLQTLAPDARAKWLGMIREHASSYQREVSTLRRELTIVFNGAGAAADVIVNQTNLAQSADRLVELSYANDEAVRAAFTISAENKDSGAIKTAQFWRSLSSAEKLAAAIERASEARP